MREIKFRFWVEKASKMSDWETAKKECDRLSILTFPGFIPMQFTGCLDKNGVEIYEGDLIRQFNGAKEPFPVFFKNGCFMWKSEPLCYDFGVRGDEEESMLYEPSHWAEVIGNIYEHPELIK